MNTEAGIFGRVTPLLPPKNAGLANLGGLGFWAVRKVDLGLNASKPKEKGVDLDNPNSKTGKDDAGSDLTVFRALTWSSELGKIVVPLRVMLNTGNDEGFIARTFALMASRSEGPSTTGFKGSICDLGLVAFSSTLNLNSKLLEGGENLKSDFGSEGGVD